jgi:hypothetical protein|tara:strand:- start:321 stop:722 length:402 start_codon:yes stop_codon:yes gene_type:complete
MATTTATITLASSDITGDTLSLSTTATLTKADSNEGLDQTQGIGRKTTTSNSQYVLYNGGDYTASKAHKVYLKNMSSSNMEYMTVHINTEELGRLYGGDWLFIPYGAHDADNDIKITPSASTSMTLEYAIFHE